MKKATNKNRGTKNERETAKYIEKKLGGKCFRTPRSGAYLDSQGDIAGKDNIVEYRKLVYECKYGDNLIPKKIEKIFEKLEDEAENGIPILDMRDAESSHDDALVVLTRRDLLKILQELQGFVEENE